MTGAPRSTDVAVVSTGADLLVSVAGRPILAGQLGSLVTLAAVSDGVLLVFLWRRGIDPDDPDAPRPLRRGRLLIVDDGQLV